MSTFAVFGRSLVAQRIAAERMVPTYCKDLKRVLTQLEWRERVEELAREKFARARATKISPMFDAPQFCGDWIRAAAGNPEIDPVGVFAHTSIIKDGAHLRDEKTGRIKYEWKSVDMAQWLDVSLLSHKEAA
jgi:hypothetical protein